MPENDEEQRNDAVQVDGAVAGGRGCVGNGADVLHERKYRVSKKRAGKGGPRHAEGHSMTEPAT